MADRFELFHLSVIPRQQGELFGAQPITREQWLRMVFAEEQPFHNYGSDFHYVPDESVSTNEAIIGRVGRHLYREENLPPSEGLKDFTHSTWLAAVLVMDPRHHDDGQKLAIQNINDVGKPASLVKRLVGSINDRYQRTQYFLEAAQIVEEQSFWNFVNENRGQITSLTFEFIAPNMFGGDDEFAKEMTAFRDSEKARRVKLTIGNTDGEIDAETPRIRRAVTYASRGGGVIKGRARRKTYSSKDDVKRSYIDEVTATGLELVKVAAKLANRILGRE